jgi:hypothetical protein
MYYKYGPKGYNLGKVIINYCYAIIPYNYVQPKLFLMQYVNAKYKP